MEKKMSYKEQAMASKARNLAFLKDLGVFETVDKLESYAKYVKERIPAKILRMNVRREMAKVPFRRSARVRKLPPAPFLEENDTTMELETSVPERLIGTFHFHEICVDDDTKALAEICSKLGPKEQNKTWHKNAFSAMHSSLIAKVVSSKIYSMSFARSSMKNLLAVGSRTGDLGFWDIDSKDENQGIFVYETHTSRVSGLAFNPENNMEVYSCSFDGTFRWGDLQHMMFKQLYRPPANNLNYLCTSFDFISPSTYLLSMRHGEAVLVDKRTKTEFGEESYVLSDMGKLKTIHFHPDKNHFITSTGFGTCSLFDLRNMERKPIYELKHQKALNSAYFSPCTGKYILTTSMDDRLNIFDSSNLAGNIKLHKVLCHDNRTGRWLAPFRAEWFPHNDDMFVVGDMSYPRSIEVYDITGKLIHIFAGNHLQTICSVNTFHPLKPIVAGGNSSGKVYIFKERQ